MKNIFKEVISKFVKSDIKQEEEFNSAKYWEERYKNGGNSGSGSYNELAEFKSEIINNFAEDNKIKDVIEFGVGDGNQLSMLKLNKYTGFDVSQTIVNKISEEYKKDSTKEFKNITEFNNQTAELSMSLDVIYHLVEDEIFEQYMNNLFRSSTKYVMIYSSNFDENHCIHVRHRKFTDWIEANQKDWKLIKHIPNKYPWNPEMPNNTSSADFYIYSKK